MFRVPQNVKIGTLKVIPLRSYVESEDYKLYLSKTIHYARYKKYRVCARSSPFFILKNL